MTVVVAVDHIVVIKLIIIVAIVKNIALHLVERTIVGIARVSVCVDGRGGRIIIGILYEIKVITIAVAR